MSNKTNNVIALFLKYAAQSRHMSKPLYIGQGSKAEAVYKRTVGAVGKAARTGVSVAGKAARAGASVAGKAARAGVAASHKYLTEVPPTKAAEKVSATAAKTGDAVTKVVRTGKRFTKGQKAFMGAAAGAAAVGGSYAMYRAYKAHKERKAVQAAAARRIASQNTSDNS